MHGTGGVRPAQKVVSVGDPAPDFVLDATGEQAVRLSNFRGSRNVLLAFYRLDWTPT